MCINDRSNELFRTRSQPVLNSESLPSDFRDDFAECRDGKPSRAVPEKKNDFENSRLRRIIN